MPPSFQFHKGTIKTIDPKLSKPVFDNFNSIKVRLKLRNVVKEEVCKADFNSIKVRLKRCYRPVRIYNKYLFQFHKGTIKTGIYINNLTFVIEFQFHKGTIKTLLQICFRFCFPISIP